MGTRGLWGIIIDGQRFGCYNGHDSYPHGLGTWMMKFINKLSPEDRVKMAGLVRNIEWIDGEGASGNGLCYDQILRGRHVRLVENVKFLQDGLFCEWAYFADFDKETFEVWAKGDFLRELTFQELREQESTVMEEVLKERYGSDEEE